MKSFRGFLTRLLIYSALILVIRLLVAPSLPPQALFEPFRLLVIFFIIATSAFHLGLLRAAAKSDQAFVRYFMGATGIKLFLYMIIMIVFATLFRDQAIAFISNFFVLYLLYSAFEVVLIYKKFSAIRNS
ncbi:MAG TPA: hypothetical protein VFW78_06515 [Bacteroidia bacterium]|nr:hypothetical protein [Bacteroidia bacterium]